MAQQPMLPGNITEPNPQPFIKFGICDNAEQYRIAFRVEKVLNEFALRSVNIPPFKTGYDDRYFDDILPMAILYSYARTIGTSDMSEDKYMALAAGEIMASTLPADQVIQDVNLARKKFSETVRKLFYHGTRVDSYTMMCDVPPDGFDIALREGSVAISADLNAQPPVKITHATRPGIVFLWANKAGLVMPPRPWTLPVIEAMNEFQLMLLLRYLSLHLKKSLLIKLILTVNVALAKPLTVSKGLLKNLSECVLPDSS